MSPTPIFLFLGFARWVSYPPRRMRMRGRSETRRDKPFPSPRRGSGEKKKEGIHRVPVSTGSASLHPWLERKRPARPNGPALGGSGLFAEILRPQFMRACPLKPAGRRRVPRPAYGGPCVFRVPLAACSQCEYHWRTSRQCHPRRMKICERPDKTVYGSLRSRELPA